jgi:hypothetical protein
LVDEVCQVFIPDMDLLIAIIQNSCSTAKAR